MSRARSFSFPHPFLRPVRDRRGVSPDCYSLQSLLSRLIHAGNAIDVSDTSRAYIGYMPADNICPHRRDIDFLTGGSSYEFAYRAGIV